MKVSSFMWCNLGSFDIWRKDIYRFYMKPLYWFYKIKQASWFLGMFRRKV